MIANLRQCFPFFSCYRLHEQSVVNDVFEERRKADSGDFNRNDEARIRELFFEKIPKLSKDFAEIAIDQIRLSKPLQNLLSEDLRLLREQKREKPELAHNPNHKLERKVAKMKLANRLGCSFQYNTKGYSSSKIAYSLSVRNLGGQWERKKVGLLKFPESSHGLFRRLFNYIKYLLGGQSYYLSADENACIASEVAAYKTKKLGFDCLNVSPAKVVEVDGKEGAFLVWQNGYREFKDIKADFEKRENYAEQEINLFQEFVIYDFLIGNLDRHEENWLVKYEGDQLKEIVPIDNEHSFIKRNPSKFSLLGGRNQYKWGELNIARQPFTEISKQLVVQNLTEERIGEMIDEYHRDLKNSREGSFFSPEMEQLFRQRAAILRKMAGSEESFTPSCLSTLRWDDSQSAFLGNPSSPL